MKGGVCERETASTRQLGKGRIFTFVHSDDEGARRAMDQAAVAIDQVGHVLGGGHT